MAGIISRYGQIPNPKLLEIVCDTVDDLQDAPTTNSYGKGVFKDYKNFAPIGSTAIVNGTDIRYFILFSDGWKEM